MRYRSRCAGAAARSRWRASARCRGTRANEDATTRLYPARADAGAEHRGRPHGDRVGWAPHRADRVAAGRGAGGEARPRPELDRPARGGAGRRIPVSRHPRRRRAAPPALRRPVGSRHPLRALSVVAAPPSPAATVHLTTPPPPPAAPRAGRVQCGQPGRRPGGTDAAPADPAQPGSPRPCGADAGGCADERAALSLPGAGAGFLGRRVGPDPGGLAAAGGGGHPGQHRGPAKHHADRHRTHPGERGFNSERGVALIVVMLVLALLALVVTEFAYSARLEASMVRAYPDTVWARHLAEPGVQQAIREILSQSQIGALDESGQLVFYRVLPGQTTPTRVRSLPRVRVPL